MTNTTSNSSSTGNAGNGSLDTATIWAAQVASDLNYGSAVSATALQWAVDPGYTNDLAAMTQAGWIQIPPQAVGKNIANDPRTNYQGIAFYKVVNGQAEVIIANRGTCQPADLLSASLGNLSASAALVDAAQAAMAASRQRYDHGEADLLEMLNAESALADAHQERIRALAEWQAARLKLLAGVGILGRSDVQ